MSLSFSRIAGHHQIDDGIQIAQDGDLKIFYIDQDIDLLREYDQDTSEEIVTHLVDEAQDQLSLLNLNTKTLIDIDCDVISKQLPVNRYAKRIYANVKDRLASMEAKYYESRNILSLLPRKIPGQRDALYIFGMSGCGKSTIASKFAEKYQLESPGNHVYIFSRKLSDPVFDSNPNLNITRVLLDRSFVKESQKPDIVDRYSNSLCIFDDFLKIDDVSIKKAALHMKNSLYELGRSYNIDIISIQHKGLGGSNSMVELTESTAIIIFPKMNLGESKRLIEKYLCFEKDQMLRIFDDRGRKERWMCIIRPNIIITENYIKIV